MIANLSLLRRRPDITRQQFGDHWIDPHGPMAASLPRLQRYVQYHVIDSDWAEPPHPEHAIDGVPALWFASQEELAAAYATPILAACNVDSEAFIGAVSRVVATPHPDERTASASTRPAHAMFVLVGDGGGNVEWFQAVTALLQNADGVVRFTGYDIVSQAAAPNSTIQDLGMSIAGFFEATFDDPSHAGRTTDSIGALSPRDCRLATFEVEPVIFV